MASIPLCVPFSCKDEARRAGAWWDGRQRIWRCSPELLATDAYLRLEPFIPRMHRPDLEPPYIAPRMVPQMAWGRNLRAVLHPEQWDVVRGAAYAATDKRCRVCAGRDAGGRIEADEDWEYDDEALTFTLKDVVALCPACHHVVHWGKSMGDGREHETYAQLMYVNRWSRPVAERVVAAAYAEWRRRALLPWTGDYSWVTRTHGFEISRAGLERAEAMNRAIVAKAIRQDEEAERAKRMVATPIPPRKPSIAAPTTAPRPPPKPEPTPKKQSIMGLLRSLVR